MGNGGNGQWIPEKVPREPSEKLIPIGSRSRKPKKKEEDPFAPPPFMPQKRRTKTEKELKLEQFKKQKAQSPEAVAERERRRQIKAMTPEQRAEYRASDKMWGRHIKKEYSKWEKTGGTNHGQWLTILAKLKKQWAKGEAKQWASKNKVQAQAIREKAWREEMWQSSKKGGII